MLMFTDCELYNLFTFFINEFLLNYSLLRNRDFMNTYGFKLFLHVILNSKKEDDISVSATVALLLEENLSVYYLSKK